MTGFKHSDGFRDHYSLVRLLQVASMYRMISDETAKFSSQERIADKVFLPSRLNFPDGARLGFEESQNCKWKQ